MPDYSKISRPGLIPVKIENQSSLITTQVNKINFSGTGVVASVGDFNDVTIQINSGGSINTGSLLTNATFSNPNLTFTRGNGTSFNVNLITLVPTSASYALSSSFAATASSADTFIVRNQLTASGLNYPVADNGEFSFIQTDGLGNLSLQYVNTLYETIYNGEATSLAKGTPVYVSGSIGANSIVYRADAGNPSKMPVIYIAADNIASGTTGRGIALGLITGVDTTGYPAGTEIYVAVGGGWTSIRPTGSATIQVLGIVTKEGSGGQGVVLNPGPANLPNLPSGSFWVGNSGSFPTPVPTSSLSVASASFASTASYVNPLVQNVFITGSTFISSSAATQLLVGNNSLFVSSSGRVGIGTTSPSEKVHIAGGNLHVQPSGSGIPHSGLLLGFGRYASDKAGLWGASDGAIPQSDGNLYIAPRNINDQNGSYIWLGQRDSTNVNDKGTVVIQAGRYGSINQTGNLFLIYGTLDRVTLHGSTGNVGIGITTPTAKTHIRGSGTTSATTAFRVENANASASLVVNDTGSVLIGTTTDAGFKLNINGTFRALNSATSYVRFESRDYFTIASRLSFEGDDFLSIFTTNTANGVSRISTGKQIQLYNRNDLTANLSNWSFYSDGNQTHTAGNVNFVRMQRTFAPTSGTGTFNMLLVGGIINQTGGANGITRGIYINPTLTSAADFRAIETTTGSVIFNDGNVGIRTTSPSSTLDVSGSARITNGLTVTGSLISPSITGSLFGTASFAISASQAISASFATTASFALNTGGTINTGSFATTGSNVFKGDQVISGSSAANGDKGLLVTNINGATTLEVANDGEIKINPIKYPLNGVLTNTGGTVTEVAGWSGIININTAPPVQIFVTNGIITNVI